MPKPVIVSAAQPTGNLHIGNYLGAVKNWVELQNSGRYQLYIFIADLHSLTGPMEADARRRQILITAAELIALGIDPKKTILFAQSYVPGHAELGWIFDCVIPLSELYRMTQFKDKSTRQEKNINAGLFTYPALMAADILLYRAEFIPVGQDQIQHLELTKDIARWFNNRYGEYFAETKPLLTETPKVMSLLEPTKKMSKSLGGGHVLELADGPEVIENKLKKAVTATAGGGKAPGAENLLLLLKQFGSADEYKRFLKAEKDGSIRYGDLKKELARAVSDYFAAFRVQRAKLLSDTGRLKKILENGAAQSKPVAEKTMAEVRKLVGIR